MEGQEQWREAFKVGLEVDAMRALRAAASQIGHETQLIADERHFESAHHGIDADMLEYLGHRLCGIARTYGTYAEYVGDALRESVSVPVEAL